MNLKNSEYQVDSNLESSMLHVRLNHFLPLKTLSIQAWLWSLKQLLLTTKVEQESQAWIQIKRKSRGPTAQKSFMVVVGCHGT